MELALLFVSVASLAANLYVAKHVLSWTKIEAVELEVVESKCLCSGHQLTETPESEVIDSPEPVVTSTPDPEQFQAWRNRKEEPVVAPPVPFGPAPKPGPMERPGGFYR